VSLNCPSCGAQLGLALEVLSGTAATPQDKRNSTALPQEHRNGGAVAQLADRGLDLVPNPTSTPAPKANPYEDPDFQAFWRIYPLKRGKRKAAQRFAIARRMVPARVVLAAAAAYAREVEGRDPTKIKWAEGWLNDHRWEDEIPDLAEDRTYAHLPVVGTREYDAWVEAEEQRAMGETVVGGDGHRRVV
jgi:hypothetical protein